MSFGLEIGIALLKQKLKDAGTAEQKRQQDRYLKVSRWFGFYHFWVISCYGVLQPQRKQIFKEIYQEHLKYVLVLFVTG